VVTTNNKSTCVNMADRFKVKSKEKTFRLTKQPVFSLYVYSLVTTTFLRSSFILRNQRCYFLAQSVIFNVA